MKPTRSVPVSVLTLLTALCWLGGAEWLGAASAASKARALFKNPPREYSTGPLWVWNDMLTEDQIRSTLRDMAKQKVKQVWVHPRPGLMTPYLSSDWFRLWKISLEEAARLDMNVWIYDENSYPSGFAGGFVPELMPQSRGRGLVIREAKTAPQWSESTIGVFRLSDDSSENISARVRAAEALPEGKYLVASEVRAGNSPWHGNRCYVNLLSPGVTEKFLEVTMEAYRKEIGSQFGKRVPGVFTDEPNIRPAGDFPWSEILAEEFQKRWGYSLIDNLPSLARPVGDWRKVRHNYMQLLNEQFIKYWAVPNHDYCKTHHLEWTGHYWDHEWPNCMGVPDNMAMYAWHQRPAIDCLMNQYAEHTHAQFGNVRMCRELLSVANQLGAKRTLCEIYGAGGWDLRFEDMKRIGDWLEVLGVNTLNQHLSYVTIRGARKRDHPQSFSYHTAWWPAYHVSAEYFARFSAALSQGEQVNRVLVLQPTTTAWMYQNTGAPLQQIGDSFFKLLMSLDAAQVEYDLLCEDVLARNGSVELSPTGTVNVGKSATRITTQTRTSELRVGNRTYPLLLIPEFTENLNRGTVELLEKFVASDGTAKVLCLGETPARIDGSVSKKAVEISKLPGWRQVQAAAVSDMLKPSGANGFAIFRTAGDKGILFHHRRQLLDGGEILALVNTSIEAPSAGTIESSLQGLEQWDLYTGEIKPYPFEKTANGVTAAFELPPSGSLLLFLSPKPMRAVAAPQEIASAIKPASEPRIRRLRPNVLTLDYLDVTAGDETRTNLYFYQANQMVWQKNGMPRDPWDSAVQFKDELISKTFPADSGFEASYRFTIAERVPAGLAIVIERSDLYTITCNGRQVSATPGDWWLDKAFGRIDIAAVAQVGDNIVTLKARPFTMYHELEPAYILGDFSLKDARSGFIIAPPQPLLLGNCGTAVTHSNNPDGTMWLSGGVELGSDAAVDRAPFILFDLGQQTDVSSLKIWNYNESHARDLTSRGVSKLRLSASNNESGPFDLNLGTFELARANGGTSPPETLTVNARGVRFVRLEVVSNHNAVNYPVSGDPADNGFVGLAEIQFFSGSDQLKGVQVVKVSSELPAHRRLAKYLVDGSGLGQSRDGWNRQGHPFYSDGVAYSELFNLGRKSGRYLVNLTDWYGSVAAVTVNGKQAGYIDAPPWQCDVTKQLKRGANEIEVTVIGTPKNLLGPHHGNPSLGSAWPGNFQHGPYPGPPGGDRYSTVAYGLFAPFELLHWTQR